MNHIFLLNACILICLGVYAYYKRRDRVAVIFLLFCGGMAVWDVCILLLEDYFLKINVNLVSQLQLTAAILFINAFYYFSCWYPVADTPLKYRLNLIAVLSLTYAILFSNFVSQAVVENNQVVFIDGFGYTLYSIYFIVIFLLSIYHLVKNYLRYDEYRVNITYLFLGVTSFLALGIYFDLILPIFGNYNYLVYGHIGSLFAPLFFTYAITKHNLLDITVVIKRNTAWFITVFIVALSFILAYHHTRQYSIINIIAITLVGLFWVFFFPSLA